MMAYKRFIINFMFSSFLDNTGGGVGEMSSRKIRLTVCQLSAVIVNMAVMKCQVILSVDRFFLWRH